MRYAASCESNNSELELFVKSRVQLLGQYYCFFAFICPLVITFVYLILLRCQSF